MGTKERRQRELEARKQYILETAQKVFFAKGYQSTTMNDITQAVELSKGTLYSHFKSKDALLFELLGQYQAASLESIQKLSETQSSGLSKLVQMGCIYLDFLKKNKGYSRILSTLMASNDSNVLSNLYASQMSVDAHKETQIVAGMIEQGKEDGSLREGLHAETLSVELFSSLMGLNLLESSIPHSSEAVQDTYNPPSMMETFLETYMRGVSTSPETASALLSKALQGMKNEHLE